MNGWHADHIHPFARGGETDITNGQALCPSCNIRKGDSMENIQLREWQIKFLDKIRIHRSDEFLLVATPGAGKTKAALYFAKQHLKSGNIDRIIVVVPSKNLKTQWVRACLDFGINLTSQWDNASIGTGMLASDYDGMVVTYQQVAFASTDVQLCKRYCHKSKTLVILDEVHHAGECLTWGDGLKSAFGEASFKLCMSGTPFRRDNKCIPFVNYVNNKSVADFNYGYGDALKDGVCRSIIFPSFNGEQEWFGYEYRIADFNEELSKDNESFRLKTALMPEGDFMKTMIAKANEKIDWLRSEEQSDAAGLLVAMNQIHAKNILDTYGDVLGDAKIAISEDPEADQVIADFVESKSKWLISVKMVSEGIDIPRLRVGVYATNVISELYFRQFVGRFVRGDETAWVMIPADKRIIEMAQFIAEEREHALSIDSDPQKKITETSSGENRNPPGFRPFSSEGDEYLFVHDGSAYDLEAIREARKFKASQDDPMINKIDDTLLAKIIQSLKPEFNSKSKSDQSRQETMDQKKRKLKKSFNNLVNRLAAITGEQHKDIHFKSPHGKIKECTVDQLEEKISWVNGILMKRR